MQKGNTILITILVIVIIAVLAIAGYFAWQYFNKYPFTTGPLVENQNANSDTAGWKTYKNDEYGFEIMYPKNFTEDKKIEIGISTSNQDKTVLSFSDYLKNIQDNVNNEKTQNISEKLFYRIIKNFKLSDKKAFTYEYTGWPSRVPSLETVVDLDGTYVLKIFVYGRGRLADINKLEKGDYSDFKELENVNDEILSTFKFIEE